MQRLSSFNLQAALAVAAALVAIALLMAPGANAELGVGVGPSGAYSFGDAGCDPEDRTDPVGVMFRGKKAWAGNVTDHIEKHVQWNEGGGFEDAWLWVRVEGGSYECRKRNTQNADADEGPWDRNHVRLWFVPASGEQEYKTMGTPHHDNYGGGCGVFKKHRTDEEITIPDFDEDGYYGIGSGYDYSRLWMADKFEKKSRHVVQYENWGNTAPIRQCNGWEPSSSGLGLIVWINSRTDPQTKNSSSRRATSSTLNGTFAPDGSTEYWFSYGPNSAEGAGNYPKKTTVKSSSSGTPDIDVNDAISGLNPGSKYYVRLFTRTADGEVEEGNEIQYETLPTSNVTVAAHPTNGQPGSSWASGTVTSGGNPVNGEWLNVNFSKKEGGVWVLKETLHPVVVNGSYSTSSFATGVGKWRVKAVLPPSEAVEEAESGYDEYEIKPGLCKTETFITPGAPVQGQPGFISVNGTVAVPNSAECGNVNGQKVNVNFLKKEGGVYVYKNTAQPTVTNGTYAVANWGVGTGEWKVKAVFYQQDWFKESESGEHPFSIVANGWHIDNLGGTFTADPDISSQGAGKLDVFGRGAENGLWIKSYPVSGGWGNWVSMGGVLGGGPGAVSWSNNRIDVVASDTGGNVAHWYWAPGWGFDYLGNGITADPDISSWGTNRLDVFARAANGNLLHKYWAGAGWSGWENMGGNIVGGPSAVSWGVNRIDVVARMTDNTIGHWWWGGAGWNYDNLGGILTSDPSISSQGWGKLDVFARGAEYGLWHRWYTTSYGNWSNWEPRGGYLTSGPGSVSWGNGRVDVVARAANNSLEHWWFQ